jgi:S-adenosylmethionine-dependent methyltransferase
VTETLWTADASRLADAYVRSAGTVRFELVTRALLTRISTAPQRVVDIGGGYGRQAILLARAGHAVTIVDIDSHMLDIAREQVMLEDADVQARIGMVEADGASATEAVGTGFDLACCHSVLMYLEDPVPLLSELVDLVRPGGMLSILCVNKDAIAMRTGLQGRWREALATLELGHLADDRYLPTKEYSRGEISGILRSLGAEVMEWFGVGIFTDHLTERLVVDDPADVYEAEWLAGSRDPYRQVARCFHLLAKRI